MFSNSEEDNNWTVIESSSKSVFQQRLTDFVAGNFVISVQYSVTETDRHVRYTALVQYRR